MDEERKLREWLKVCADAKLQKELQELERKRKEVEEKQRRESEGTADAQANGMLPCGIRLDQAERWVQMCWWCSLDGRLADCEDDGIGISSVWKSSSNVVLLILSRFPPSLIHPSSVDHLRSLIFEPHAYMQVHRIFLHGAA